VNIVGFNNLTIQGGPSATITTGMDVINSSFVPLSSSTFILRRLAET